MEFNAKDAEAALVRVASPQFAKTNNVVSGGFPIVKLVLLYSA